MALALEIEFLGGVCYAAIGPDSDAPDWPPQPDRVFSALVATWAAHGQPDDERRALEWLEALPVPLYRHGDPYGRSAPMAFVPPNDYATPLGELASLKWFRDYLSQGAMPPKTGNYRKEWKRAWGVLPDERKRSGLKARRFPAARLQDPLVHHYWPAEPDETTLAALDRLARDTAYVGHSASLTRCRFSRAAPADGVALRPARRRVYPGRLQELCAAHARFERSADKKDRPSLGAPVPPTPRAPDARANVFSDHWLVLEHLDGVMPDLRAAALVARGIRIALMSGYGQLGLPVTPEVSGHEADGSPARQAHMAVVPLSFTGFEHADGRMLGFALVPPSPGALLDDADFLSVLRRLTRRDAATGRRVLDLKSAEGTAHGGAFALTLAPSFEPPAGKRSLDPALYTATARHFATVTPIALDRHPKARGTARLEEMAELVAAACVRIGLPRPESVRVDKHATPQGAPSAYPSGDAPAWMRWRLPASLAGRPLTHAFIQFNEPVAGPLLLGAGRFVGLGLCRPLAERKV